MPEKAKRNLVMPQEVFDAFDSIVEQPYEVRDAYMRLLRDAGWTLQSISDAVGDISRERVRQCIEEMPSRRAPAILRKYSAILPIPEPPDKPEAPEKPRKVIVLPSDETLQRLKELKPIAAQVRYNRKDYREEAAEYVSLLWDAHTKQGVSVYRLAKLLDVTPAGIESRFVRYRYKESSGSSKAFDPIKYGKVRPTKTRST